MINKIDKIPLGEMDIIQLVRCKDKVILHQRLKGVVEGLKEKIRLYEKTRVYIRYGGVWELNVDLIIIGEGEFEEKLKVKQEQIIIDIIQ